MLVGITGGILIANRYQLRPKSLKLPFIEFDSSRFGDLSPVVLFSAVSRVAIKPSVAAAQWLGSKPDITPLLLVHIGWQIVSNAFVTRWLSYPTDANIASHINELGVQNAEFIAVFEKIYRSAIRHQDTLTSDFAKEYFLRAPSLATRITGDASYDEEPLFQMIAAYLPSLDHPR